jgi:hypothetical protein
MTMTKTSIISTNQKRCSDPECELFDGEDADGETEDGEDNSARPRPKKQQLTPAQVSSFRVSAPVAIEPAATQGTLPTVAQKPRIIVKAPSPKIVGTFSGGESNKSNARGKK